MEENTKFTEPPKGLIDKATEENLMKDLKEMGVHAPAISAVESEKIMEAKEVSQDEAPTAEVTPASIEVKEEIKMANFSIQGVDISLPRKAVNTNFAQSIILLDVFGKPYWDGFKKVFNVNEPVMAGIKNIFEPEIAATE